MTAIDFSVDTIAYPGFKSQWGLEGNVFSRQTEDFDQSGESADLDASTWGSRFENMLPGMQKANSKITGVHTGTKAGIGDVLGQLVGRSSPVRAWSAFESLNVLSPVSFQPCSVKKYSVKSTKKDVVKFDAELDARGDYNKGFIIMSPKSTTQMITTGTGSVDDNTNNGGATAFGGVVQMHLFDLSGGATPTLAVTVQHSPDGTTWTTLATFVTAVFTSLSTTYVQRIKIPSTTTINAQVRLSWVTTGAPTSVQGIVMYSRSTDFDA